MYKNKQNKTKIISCNFRFEK